MRSDFSLRDKTGQQHKIGEQLNVVAFLFMSFTYDRILGLTVHKPFYAWWKRFE